MIIHVSRVDSIFVLSFHRYIYRNCYVLQGLEFLFKIQLVGCQISRTMPLLLKISAEMESTGEIDITQSKI